MITKEQTISSTHVSQSRNPTHRALQHRLRLHNKELPELLAKTDNKLTNIKKASVIQIMKLLLVEMLTTITLRVHGRLVTKIDNKSTMQQTIYYWNKIFQVEVYQLKSDQSTTRLMQRMMVSNTNKSELAELTKVLQL